MFGLPSEEPSQYWRPELGALSISPENIGLLSPAQMRWAYDVGKRLLR